MKKLLALLLAALLIFCMAACKKDKAKADDTDNNKAASDQMTKDYFVYDVSEDGNYKIVDFTYTGIEKIDVKIPEQLGEDVNQRAVTEIADEAFKSLHNIKSVTLPSTVIRIGEHAFYDCDFLTAIKIPASVTSIGFGAFESCSTLETVELSQGLLMIDDSAFASCVKLSKITLPEGLLAIGDGAFQECDALTAIEIPASVISIGDAAFFGCNTLASLTVKHVENKTDAAFIEALRTAKDEYLTENKLDAPETFAELKVVMEAMGFYMAEIKDEGCKYVWDKNANVIYGAINAADAELVAKCNAALAAAAADEKNPYVPASINALELFLKEKELEVKKLNISVNVNKYAWSQLDEFLCYLDLGQAIFANCPALTTVVAEDGTHFANYLKDAGYTLTVIPEATPAA